MMRVLLFPTFHLPAMPQTMLVPRCCWLRFCVPFSKVRCIVTFSLRSSLNSQADPLYMTYISAGLGRKLSGLAGYRYDMINVIDRMRSTVHRLVCNGAPPSPLAQERPTTTPTKWYCHKCRTGPYSISAQTSCTNVINGHQCDHRMCHYCEKE